MATQDARPTDSKKYSYYWYVLKSGNQSGTELRVFLRILKRENENVSIFFEYSSSTSGPNYARICKHRSVFHIKI